MIRLKNILQFNTKFIILLILVFTYVFIVTKIITYDSKYTNETTIEGKIHYYYIDGNKLSLEILGKEKILTKYYIEEEKEKKYLEDKLCIGCTIIINGNLNDFNNNTMPNTFNYKKYLYNKKIYKMFIIDNIDLIKNDNNIIYKIKNYFYKRINSLDNKEYILMFIMGKKDIFETDKYNEFKINGTSHLLAISGMHIGVIISLLNKILKSINRIKKLIIISIILFIYAFIVDFTPSVLRVIIFYCLLSLKKNFNIRIHDLKLLILCGLIIMIVNPFIIYDIGFLYSFVISFAIILNKNKISGNYFKKIFIISFISILYSLPITINLNYELNIMSIFFNMISVPFISLIFYPVCLLTFLLPFLMPLLNILIFILEIINKYCASLSIMINIPKMSYYQIIIYYLLLVNYKKGKNIYLLLYIILLKTLPFIDNNFKLFYLDVGQGDSLLLIMPYKSNVTLIDTGGKIKYKQESWEKSVKKYQTSNNTILLLKSMGITKINNMIITHGDYDHLGEATYIIQNFKVEKVIFNCGEYNNLEKELIKVLDKNNIKYNSCIKKLNIGKYELQFLNTKVYDNENDNSSVIYLNYNDYKFLFMGDAGIKKEEDILDKYNLKDIDFLKIGHHGSNTSSGKNFINYINPKYSIISVGKNNSYGHPKNTVLDTLKSSIIYRTDYDGSIVIKLNKNGYKIFLYPP